MSDVGIMALQILGTVSGAIAVLFAGAFLVIYVAIERGEAGDRE